ncbi:hypothetical protein F5Y17DRAFT_190821 [Xylariaceae sp. FL0594]|nr:hypothetical protein F5Y17DRAFT_190821 [Xylariaceae sp. FL0594]
MSPFLNDLRNVTQNTDILLQWGPSATDEFPLQLQARILNRTGDYEIKVEEKVIATGLAANSYIWKDLPSPLPYLSTATYQLEVRPREREVAADSDLVIASSPQFTILPHGRNDIVRLEEGGRRREEEEGEPANKTSPSPSPSTSGPSFVFPRPSTTPLSNPHTSGHHDSSAAVAAGVAIPVVVIISIAIFIFMNRRRSRSLEDHHETGEEAFY